MTIDPLGEVLVEADQGGLGIHARGGRIAGLFEGDVQITGQLRGAITCDGSLGVAGDISCGGGLDVAGDIRLLNADCAEEFDVVEGLSLQPGTVVVLDDEGLLRPSQSAYDKRVAGVLSGAGDYRPALTLDTRTSAHDRLPVALMGKVYCRVDATQAAIQVGDLLTTSNEGRAMKASDPGRAFGAVIGKALRALEGGVGLIPVLVARQ